MGMYTTQIKTICESIYMSKNNLTVDELLNDRSYEHNFNTDLPDMTPYTICKNASVQARIFQNVVFGESSILYPLYDNDYRKELQYKILIHYYTREICEETFALWKLRLISKLNDIMPYYNQLYTETFEKYLGTNYNLFDNIDITTTDNFDKKIEKIVESVLNEEMKNKNSSESSSTESNSGTDKTSYKRDYTHGLGGAGYTDSLGNGKTTKVSDTPQGSVTNITNGYLTQVTVETGDIVKRKYNSDDSVSETFKDNANSGEEFEHGHTINSSNESSENAQRNINTTNDENEKANEKSKNIKIMHGKNSNQSYAKLIKEIRENIINIDKMIIDELEPLFFGLW